MARSSNSSASSLGQSAYLRLRSDLLSGKLAPGIKLKIADLAESHGISSAGIREALSRLAAEGLAIAEPQKGFRATPLSEVELRDLTMVRSRIEGLCLERAIELGDLAWEADIAAAIHRLSRVPEQAADREPAFGVAWSAAHAAFHASLVAACDSPWLLRLRDQLWWHSERYRQASVAVAGEARDIRKEHEDLAAAVLAREVRRAVTLMETHLKLTAESLLARVHFQPAHEDNAEAMPIGRLIASAGGLLSS
jgi:DNA-binding GntR family transcriptional regulator